MRLGADVGTLHEASNRPTGLIKDWITRPHWAADGTRGRGLDPPQPLGVRLQRAFSHCFGLSGDLGRQSHRLSRQRPCQDGHVRMKPCEQPKWMPGVGLPGQIDRYREP
jgi:hypothetical protein